MREMKESGVTWLGKIPKTWNIVRAKNIFKNHKDIVGEKENEYERLALTLNGVLKRAKDDIKGLQSESLSTYQILNEKELVFKMIDLANVNTSRVGYSPYQGIVSPVYIIFNNDKYTKFGYYYFYNMWQREVFNHLGNDGVRSALNASDMLNLPFPNITIEEANKIAKFLDKKTNEINSIIEKTKETIEDYKKYKQSLITKIVTKGLEKNNKNRDVFADNLKELPFDWRYMPLKYFVKLNANSLSDSTDENYKFKYVEIGAVSLSDGIMEYQEYIFKNSPSRARRVVKEGDIIVSTVRTYLKAIAIIKDAQDVIVSTGFAVLEPMNINKDYLGWIIKSDYFTDIVSAKSNGISYPAINASDLINIKIPVPSIKEQTQIANKLNNVCKKIDKLIYDKEKIIEELEEYKKSLIYEYVTGKKEVV